MIEEGKSYSIDIGALDKKDLDSGLKDIGENHMVAVRKILSKDWVVGGLHSPSTRRDIEVLVNTSFLKADGQRITNIGVEHTINIFNGLLDGWNRDIKIAVVGCGGTGSWVARDLARVIKSFNVTEAGDGRRRNRPVAKALLIDGDLVEKKNTVRQNFIETDIGKPKAEVLAKRYGRAFGVDMLYSNSFLDEKAEILEEFRPNIILGCVDNDPSRLAIQNMVKRHSDHGDPIVWIDSGNEKLAGQAIISVTRSHYYRDTMKPISEFYGSNSTLRDWKLSTPYVFDLFKPKEDEKMPDQQSCAEAAESAPQHMMINSVAANVIMNIVAKLMFKEPLNYYMVYYSVNNLMRVVPSTFANIYKKSITPA